MFFIHPQIQIPWNEIEFSFVRSSGPGGQNVNKVNSKAVLKWNPLESQCAFGEVYERLIEKLKPRLNQADQIVISSDRYRDQIRNKEDCLEKLKDLCLKAIVRKKKRKKTQPSLSSRQKAKKTKRKHSDKKRLRRQPRFEE